MKWRSNPHPVMKWGDTRSSVIFALMPHNCADGNTRWLERVVKVERVCYSLFMGLEGLSWETDHYESVERELSK